MRRQYLFSSFDETFCVDFAKQSREERENAYLELLEMPFISTDEYKNFEKYLTNSLEKVGGTKEEIKALEVLKIALKPLSLIFSAIGAVISDRFFNRKQLLKDLLTKKEELVTALRVKYKDVPFGKYLEDLNEAQKASFEKYKEEKASLIKEKY